MIPLCKALGRGGCWPFCKGAGCEHPSCYYKLVTQVLLGNFNGDSEGAKALWNLGWVGSRSIGVKRRVLRDSDILHYKLC